MWKENRTTDRRHAPRYQFIADAKVTELPSNANHQAKTGDLSIGGCFLHMANPLPQGSQIQINIAHANTTFTTRGRVAFVRPSLGMGVTFTSMERDQQVVLQEWVGELSHCTHAFQSKYERVFAEYKTPGGHLRKFPVLALLLFACLLVCAAGFFSK